MNVLTLGGWTKWEPLGITDEDINNIMIKNNKTGAVPQLLLDILKAGRHATQEEDFGGVDYVQETPSGYEEYQAKGYNNIQDSLYAGVNEKDGISNGLKKHFLMIKEKINFSDAKVEILFEDEKFKNDIRYHLNKLLKFKYIYHVAINHEEKIFKIIAVFSKKQILDNIDLIRYKPQITNNHDEFVIDRLEILKRTGDEI